MAKFDRCDSCGTAYLDTKIWPRVCHAIIDDKACGNIVWNNPIPVTCVIQPVAIESRRVGALVGRRGIKTDPGYNKFSFPGGFLEEETSQEGGAREVFEEMGLTIDPDDLTPIWFKSSSPRHNRVLLFHMGVVMPLEQIESQLKLTSETTEIGLIFGPGNLEELFCFPTHIDAFKYVTRGSTIPHDYRKLL